MNPDSARPRQHSPQPAHPRPHDHTHDHDHDHDHEHEHATGLVGFVRSLVQPHSHDAAEKVDSALEASRDGIRTVTVSLAALMATALVQLAVVLVTGSVALLADTIHNFSDALTAVPLWIAFALSRRPANHRYTYGYGRAEDLAGLFIVAMIALSALVAGYESVRRLLDPTPPTNVGVLLAAGLLGFVGNEAVAVYRLRVGRRIGSAALVADGLHARTDGFTSLAVAAGAVGVMVGFPLADPLIGLLITVAILLVLRGVARDVWHRLMDAVDPGLVARSEQVLLEVSGVRAVESLRLRWLGHRLRAEAELAVDGTLDVAAGHAVAHDAEQALKHALPKLDTVVVHVGPAPGRQTTVAPAGGVGPMGSTS